MAKKHNWLLIVLGIVIFVVILGIAAVAGFGYYMYRQMDVTKTTTSNADAELSEVRARFDGQVPFIEMTDLDDRTPVVHHEQEKEHAAPIKHLRVVAFVPEENTLVRLRIPMWLLRIGRDKPISIESGGSGFRWGVGDMKLNVTARDIERHGPGLILDTTGRRGEKMIVWAE